MTQPPPDPPADPADSDAPAPLSPADAPQPEGSQADDSRPPLAAPQSDTSDVAAAAGLAELPKGWGPINESVGLRCQACGDLLNHPAGCYACNPASPEERAPEVLPNLSVGRGFAPFELLRGALCLPRGAFYVVRHPRLWKLAAVPLLINLLVVVGAFLLAHYVLAPWIEAKTTPESFSAWTGWFWGSLAWLLGALRFGLTLIIDLIVPLLAVWLLIAFPLGIAYKALFTPFMAALGAAADRDLLVDGSDRLRYQTEQVTIAWGLVDTLVLGLLQGAVLLLLLPINLIPGVGNLVWLIVPPTVFACMDFSDIHLVRRGYTTREKIRLWWTHRWRFLGYGASFYLLLTIPLLNAFAIPAATVGGALLYLELDRK